MSRVDWARVDADLASHTVDRAAFQQAVDRGVALGAKRFGRQLRTRQVAAVAVVGVVLGGGFLARAVVATKQGPTASSSASTVPTSSATTAPVSSGAATTGSAGSSPSVATSDATASPTTTSTTAPPPAPSTSTATAGPPGAPSVVAHGFDNRIKLSVTPPRSDAGSAITEYRATCQSSDGGDPATGQASASDVAADALLVVPGTSGGHTYTCTAVAVNGVGTGPPSAPSDPVVPNGIPDPPISVSAAPGSTDGAIVVTFRPPLNKGGPNETVSRFTVYCSTLGSADSVVDGGSSPITVAGLDITRTYACRVTAWNRLGQSLPSASTTPISPRFG